MQQNKLLKKIYNLFTIIKPVIVISIFTLIMIYSYAYYNSGFDPGIYSRGDTKLKMELVADACDRYAIDNGGKYPQAINELYPKYLSKIPKSAWGDTIEIIHGADIEIVCYVQNVFLKKTLYKNHLIKK